VCFIFLYASFWLWAPLRWLCPPLPNHVRMQGHMSPISTFFQDFLHAPPLVQASAFSSPESFAWSRLFLIPGWQEMIFSPRGPPWSSPPSNLTALKTPCSHGCFFFWSQGSGRHHPVVILSCTRISAFFFFFVNRKSYYDALFGPSLAIGVRRNLL